MILYSKKAVSPKGTVNDVDLRKIMRDTAIFFAAPALIYLTSIQGIISQNGFVGLRELAPDPVTIGALEGWGIGIAINFFLKLNSRK